MTNFEFASHDLVADSIREGITDKVLFEKRPAKLPDGTVVEGLYNAWITLNNPSEKIAFFERAEVLDSPDGDEILPVEYSDNYLTVYPGESVQLQADVPAGSAPGWVRVTGYNTDAGVVPIADANR